MALHYWNVIETYLKYSIIGQIAQALAISLLAGQGSDAGQETALVKA